MLCNLLTEKEQTKLFSNTLKTLLIQKLKSMNNCSPFFSTHCMAHFFAVTICLLAYPWLTTQTAAAATIDYTDSQYDYTWTDESGVEHSAKLTDEATDPRQILALFKKVYLDPRVPGIQYGDEYNNTNKIDYTKHSYKDSKTSNGRIAWLDMEDGATVDQPDDGMSVLYIEVKPSFNSSTDKTVPSDISGTTEGDLYYVDKCYQMVKFIPTYLRVTDETNPGYLFTIDKTVASNRFFFVSKGRWRQDSGTTPLWGSFEEISPNNGNGTSPTTNLADSLEAGTIYNCIHSCGSVPSITQPSNTTYGHEFVLNRTGSLSAFTGLSLFVPDRRLTSANTTTGTKNTGNSTYNTSYAPASFLYKAYLTATAVASDEKTDYYKVTLDWETSMTKSEQASKMGITVNEQFYIYIVDEDGNRTLIDQVTNGQGDPDYHSPVKELTHSYLVPMTSTKQTITFIISANPLNKDDEASNIYVYSNTATVEIPGLDRPFFLRAGEYRSRFDVQNERNLYRNTVSISPQDWKNMGEVANSYELTREWSEYDETAEADKTCEAVVATVTFSDVDVDNKTATYTVTYNAESQCASDEETFDGVSPLTSDTGTLTASNVINIYDRFNAGTADGSQPTSYTYNFLSCENGIKNTASDSLLIPVFVTPVDCYIEQFTKQQVDNDTVCKLTEGASRMNIIFNVVADANGEVNNYETVNINDSERVTGRAKRPSGSNDYALMSVIDNKETSEGTVTSSVAGVQITLYDQFASANDPYCVRINTKPSFDGGSTTVENSYGSKRVSVSGPELTFEASASGHSKSWWAAANVTHAAFGALLTLTPSLPEEARTLYLYRVWRQNADGTYTLLNNEVEKDKQTWTNETTQETVSTSYGNLIDNLDPEAPTSVSDIYIDTEPTSSREVTYIARMYSTLTAETADAPRKSSADTYPAVYYITQAKATVVYNHDVVTGVETVNTSSPAVRVTYYSVTGQQSATPWQGVNVKVTCHADGTTTVTKAIN